jgi:hypothetical protein
MHQLTPAQIARRQMFASVFRWLAAEIAPHLPPGRSARPFASLIREDSLMLIYGLTLPTATAPDVVTW